MDEKIIFYIVIGIVYFLYNFLKRKKQAGAGTEEPQQQNFPRPGQPTTQPKPLTFEELLKEITEGKQVRTEPTPVAEYKMPVPEYKKPVPHQDFVDYDDDLGEEAKDLEEEPYDYRKKDPIYDQYEEAKRMAFQRASLEESEKLEKVDVRFGRFKEFETARQRNLVEEYTRDLRDPEGFKKALILSEILNRKHF